MPTYLYGIHTTGRMLFKKEHEYNLIKTNQSEFMQRRRSSIRNNK